MGGVRSHTAGAVRLGLFARALLGGPPRKAEMALHGSFAATGEGGLSVEQGVDGNGCASDSILGGLPRRFRPAVHVDHQSTDEVSWE